MRLAVAVAAALALALPPAAAAWQGRLVADSFSSPGLEGRLSFDVYLPPGYDSSGLHYPVVYYLHGLPAGPRGFTTFGYVVTALESIHGNAIVVAPQGARDGDADAEYLDWGLGREWQTAIGVELPRVVDRRYRTIPTRAARALVGVSAGGYGAAIIGLRHLDEFGVLESWSGYFHPTDPSGLHYLSLGPASWASTYVPQLARTPTFLGFYVGAADARFRADNVGFARVLSRAHVPFTFRMYPGGHEQSLWTSQAPAWLALALAHLSPAK
ncbi:MAG TPA: alpha/beta hydrolase-fold protein [Gaiellaceae bacterium]|nr:alpha/beta hydrolase-fold protein [Gaiellaceae bacterium]